MKRFTAAMLAAIIMLSVFCFASFAADTDPVTGKTVTTLSNEIADFIKTSGMLIKKDDYDNMPEEQQFKLPATAELEVLVDEAKTARSSRDAAKMGEFLCRVYKGWNAEISDYNDKNSVYVPIQEAIGARTTFEGFIYNGGGYNTYYGNDSFVKIGAGMAYNNLVRKEYTIESWAVLASFIKNLEKVWVSDGSQWKLLTATRSEIYACFLEYMDAYNQLVKAPDGTDLEVNKVKGYLYDVYNVKELYGFTWDEIYATSDLHETLAERDALKAWVDGAAAVLEKTDATLADLAPYLNIDSDSNAEHVKVRDHLLETYRLAHFVGQVYQKAKDELYTEAKVDYDAGYYADKDWSAFTSTFDRGDAIKGSYLTKESELTECYEGMTEAYEVLKTKKIDAAIYPEIYAKVAMTVENLDASAFTTESYDALTYTLGKYASAVANIKNFTERYEATPNPIFLTMITNNTKEAYRAANQALADIKALVLVDGEAITAIEVTEEPTQKQYYLGDDELNTDGMIVTATLTSGKKTAILTYNVAGFDTASVGEKTITVSYGTMTDTFTIQVSEKDVYFSVYSNVEDGYMYVNIFADIKTGVSGMQLALEYDTSVLTLDNALATNAAEDLFDNYSVNADINNGDETDEEYETNRINITAVATTDVAPTETMIAGIRFTAKDGAKASSFNLVNASDVGIIGGGDDRDLVYGVAKLEREAVEISIESLDKTEYNKGEALEELNVYLVYNDGSMQSVDNDKYTVTGYDAETTGEQTVTVTYGDFTDSVVVTVKVPYLTGDVDLSGGAPTIADALTLFKHVAGVALITDADALAVADIDGTAGVTIADALTLFKFVAGVISEI